MIDPLPLFQYTNGPSDHQSEFLFCSSTSRIDAYVDRQVLYENSKS